MKKVSVLTMACAIALTAVIVSALTALYLMGGIGSGSSALQKYARLETMRQVIEKHYYIEVDDETLLNGALKGMLASLNDPYTYYITPQEAQVREESESLSYMGLGITVQLREDGNLEVVLIMGGTPADQAGIQVGDLITRINGEDVKGKDLNEAVSMIRDAENEQISAEILRGDETLIITVTPEPIPISNINYTMLDDRIGYIGITQFAGNDVEDFTAALEELQAEGAKGLIIDVRGNPGGYLDHVTRIADQLLPEALLVYTQDRSGKRVDHYSDAQYCDLPVCVLVNGASASASEILTAAIKDNNRGTVIGTQTYGKGIVQSVYTFEDDGAAMQFTSSTYYTPNGVCIHGTGVAPDIVEEDEEEQILKAIDILNEAINDER